MKNTIDNKKYMKICMIEECKKVFTTNRSDKLYCCRDCSHAANLIKSSIRGMEIRNNSKKKSKISKHIIKPDSYSSVGSGHKRGLLKKGERFSMLTVICLDHIIEYEGKRQKEEFYLFKCDCGVEKVINGKTVKYGQTKSCGCLSKHRGTYNVRKKHITGLESIEERAEPYVYIDVLKIIKKSSLDELAVISSKCKFCTFQILKDIKTGRLPLNIKQERELKTVLA